MFRLNKINIRVAISPFCNFNCIYCDGQKSRKLGKPGAMEDFRRTPLKKGDIDIETLMHIIKVFYEVGFSGITLTGGEPLLNPNWDLIINQSRTLGMARAEVTTNGILLSDYLDKKGKLPSGLTLIKIGFDTCRPERFKKITGGGDINKIIESVKAVSLQIKTRANKVVLQTDMPDLMQYLCDCHKIGFHEVTLLDLVSYPNRDDQASRSFFEKEYVPFTQLSKYLKQYEDVKFKPHKYGHEAVLSSGLRIFIKDSNLTMRDNQCLNCPLFCQEGKYTFRVATDGNITQCPDYIAELSSIDGSKELTRGLLLTKLNKCVSSFIVAKKMKTIKRFLEVHDLHLCR